MKKDGDPRPAIAEKMRADFERERDEWNRYERKLGAIMLSIGAFYALFLMMAIILYWWKS